MFLLACGAVVNKYEALLALKNSILKYNISHLIGFTSPVFNSYITTDFVRDFVTRVAIDGQKPDHGAMTNMLTCSHLLRRHGSVITFERVVGAKSTRAYVQVYEYTWIHTRLAPGGVPAPYQCTHCFAIGKVSGFVREKDHKAGWRCKVCRKGEEYAFYVSEDVTLMNDMGGWIKGKRFCTSSASYM